MLKIFDGLNLRETPAKILLQLHKEYDFTNKIILEIGSDLNLQTAKAILRLGAKHVFSANPLFTNLHSPDSAITVLKAYGEDNSFLDRTFDIILGLALLEHVLFPQKLALECKRMLRVGGGCLFTGQPYVDCL